MRSSRSTTTRRPPALDPGVVIPGTHAPVVGPSAEALGARRVLVRWTGVAGGDVRNRVYRDGTLIGDMPRSVDSFVDRWAAPGQTYTYQVRTAEPVVVEAARAWRESAAIDVSATTPAISVVLDPGHGGRDPGAVRRY